MLDVFNVGGDESRAMRMGCSRNHQAQAPRAAMTSVIDRLQRTMSPLRGAGTPIAYARRYRVKPMGVMLRKLHEQARLALHGM